VTLIYASALRITRDHDEAERVLQITIIKTCAALPTFDGASKLGIWIYRIATNEALMLLRQRKPHLPLDAVADIPPDELPPQRQAWEPDPLRAALDDERLTYVEHAIAALPEQLRIVVLLRDLEGRSTEEVARLLGLTPGAVKVRLHRARLRLRDALAGYLTTISDVDGGAP
jgi:RNA polymerase sigma-70 factor (ECF subfamily)